MLSSSATGKGTAAEGEARLGCEASQVTELKQGVVMRDKLVWSWFGAKLASLNIFISFLNRDEMFTAQLGIALVMDLEGRPSCHCGGIKGTITNLWKRSLKLLFYETSC